MKFLCEKVGLHIKLRHDDDTLLYYARSKVKLKNGHRVHPHQGNVGLKISSRSDNIFHFQSRFVKKSTEFFDLLNGCKSGFLWTV